MQIITNAIKRTAIDIYEKPYQMLISVVLAHNITGYIDIFDMGEVQNVHQYTLDMIETAGFITFIGFFCRLIGNKFPRTRCLGIYIGLVLKYCLPTIALWITYIIFESDNKKREYYINYFELLHDKMLRDYKARREVRIIQEV